MTLLTRNRLLPSTASQCRRLVLPQVDCYSLAPESRCAATINGSSSFVTPCSLCSSRYRFGAAPRVCSSSTATCTCAGGSTDTVSEFSVGLRPHVATLTATSVMEDGGSAVECQWHFQTLQGDEEDACQQQQQELLLRGVRSSTRLVLPGGDRFRRFGILRSAAATPAR